MFPRILVVDDEKNIRNILTKLLRDEQYTVQAAASAKQAMGFGMSLVIVVAWPQ